MSPAEAHDGRTEEAPKLLRTALALAALYLLDLFVTGMGVLSLVTSLVGVTFLLPLALPALISGARPRALSRLLRAGMYLLFGAATVFTVTFQMATAKSRADQLIQACRAYRSRWRTPKPGH